MCGIYNPIICYLIMENNICQSDWCFSWSGFTIVRKFWPIKEEKGEPSLKSKLTSNPPPPLKKTQKNHICPSGPFLKCIKCFDFFFPVYTILRMSIRKDFIVNCLLKTRYILMRALNLDPLLELNKWKFWYPFPCDLRELINFPWRRGILSGVI